MNLSGNSSFWEDEEIDEKGKGPTCYLSEEQIMCMRVAQYFLYTEGAVMAVFILYWLYKNFGAIYAWFCTTRVIPDDDGVFLIKSIQFVLRPLGNTDDYGANHGIHGVMGQVFPCTDTTCEETVEGKHSIIKMLVKSGVKALNDTAKFTTLQWLDAVLADHVHLKDLEHCVIRVAATAINYMGKKQYSITGFVVLNMAAYGGCSVQDEAIAGIAGGAAGGLSVLSIAMNPMGTVAAGAAVFACFLLICVAIGLCCCHCKTKKVATETLEMCEASWYRETQQIILKERKERNRATAELEIMAAANHVDSISYSTDVTPRSDEIRAAMSSPNVLMPTEPAIFDGGVQNIFAESEMELKTKKVLPPIKRKQAWSGGNSSGGKVPFVVTPIMVLSLATKANTLDVGFVTNEILGGEWICPMMGYTQIVAASVSAVSFVIMILAAVCNFQKGFGTVYRLMLMFVAYSVQLIAIGIYYIEPTANGFKMFWSFAQPISTIISLVLLLKTLWSMRNDYEKEGKLQFSIHFDNTRPLRTAGRRLLSTTLSKLGLAMLVMNTLITGVITEPTALVDKQAAMYNPMSRDITSVTAVFNINEYEDRLSTLASQQLQLHMPRIVVINSNNNAPEMVNFNTANGAIHKSDGTLVVPQTSCKFVTYNYAGGVGTPKNQPPGCLQVDFPFCINAVNLPTHTATGGPIAMYKCGHWYVLPSYFDLIVGERVRLKRTVCTAKRGSDFEVMWGKELSEHTSAYYSGGKLWYECVVSAHACAKCVSRADFITSMQLQNEINANILNTFQEVAGAIKDLQEGVNAAVQELVDQINDRLNITNTRITETQERLEQSVAVSDFNLITNVATNSYTKRVEAAISDVLSAKGFITELLNMPARGNEPTSVILPIDEWAATLLEIMVESLPAQHIIIDKTFWFEGSTGEIIMRAHMEYAEPAPQMYTISFRQIFSDPNKECMSYHLPEPVDTVIDVTSKTIITSYDSQIFCDKCLGNQLFFQPLEKPLMDLFDEMPEGHNILSVKTPQWLAARHKGPCEHNVIRKVYFERLRNLMYVYVSEVSYLALYGNDNSLKKAEIEIPAGLSRTSTSGHYKVRIRSGASEVRFLIDSVQSKIPLNETWMFDRLLATFMPSFNTSSVVWGTGEPTPIDAPIIDIDYSKLENSMATLETSIEKKQNWTDAYIANGTNAVSDQIKDLVGGETGLWVAFSFVIVWLLAVTIVIVIMYCQKNMARVANRAAALSLPMSG